MPYYLSNAQGASFAQVKQWSRSPRINGKLVLQTLPHVRVKAWLTKKGPLYSSNTTLISNHESVNSNVASYVNSRAPQVYARCFGKFKDAAWDDTRSALLVDLAERKETMKMLGDTILRVFKALSLVRRKRFKEAARHLGLTKVPKGVKPSKAFLDNWMAFRYGWGPFVSSASDLLEVLDTTPRDHYIESFASGDIKTVVGTQPRYSYSAVARVHIKGKVEVSNYTMARLNQYGVLNPLSAGLELITKSWVIGWFISVGDFLDNLSAFWGLRISEISVTYAHTGELVTDGYYSGKWQLFHNRYVRAKERTTPSTLPIPSIIVGNGMNPTRVMDALALVNNLLRRK